MLFLSTLSLRRATRFKAQVCNFLYYFYPRSPCGERRPSITGCFFDAMHFYPRSPCGERPETAKTSNADTNFYPRSPCGERLKGVAGQDLYYVISIHALLAESDPALLTPRMDRRYFYPRSPCGERQPQNEIIAFDNGFLSTLSLRRATNPTNQTNLPNKFLSTLSLRRATLKIRLHYFLITNFYPRSPCGERLFEYIQAGTGILFLSTLSLRRATAKVHKTVGHFCAYETNFMGIASSC